MHIEFKFILFTSMVVLLLFLKNVNTQECRQVTVCDQDRMKGEKGDIGFPGKVCARIESKNRAVR